MKKNILLILAILILAAVATFIFISVSQTNMKGGFERKIRSDRLAVRSALKIGRKFYFANIEDDKIILKDSSRPWILAETNSRLDSLTLMNKILPLHFLADSSQAVYSAIRENDQAYFDLKSGKLIAGKMTSSQFKSFQFKPNQFDQFFLLSDQVICCRSVSTSDNVLGRKLTTFALNGAGPQVIANYEIQNQNEGYFSTDGLLQFSPLTGKMIYMYFYKGSFTILDTNLKAKLHVKTIDTVHKSDLKLIENETRLENGTIRREAKIQGIPKFVNRTFTTDQKFIYIISNAQANNESPKAAEGNEIVDVYDINNGRYKGSFYFPKMHGKRVREIKVSGSNIFATSGEYVIRTDNPFAS